MSRQPDPPRRFRCAVAAVASVLTTIAAPQQAPAGGPRAVDASPGAVTIRHADPARDRVVPPLLPGALWGADAAVLADCTGDGAADVAFGAPLASAGGRERGLVAVYCGRTGRLASVLRGRHDGAQLGRTVVAAGDLDGDGRGDLLVGGWTKAGAGQIACWTPGEAAPRGAIVSTTLRDGFGFDAAVIGDLDGDGTADVAIASPIADHAGRIQLVSGAALLEGTHAAPAVRLGTWPDAATDPGEQVHLIGGLLAAAGDHTGDGQPELLVGRVRVASGAARAEVVCIDPVVGQHMQTICEPPLAADLTGDLVVDGADVDLALDRLARPPDGTPDTVPGDRARNVELALADLGRRHPLADLVADPHRGAAKLRRWHAAGGGVCEPGRAPRRRPTAVDPVPVPLGPDGPCWLDGVDDGGPPWGGDGGPADPGGDGDDGGDGDGGDGDDPVDDCTEPTIDLRIDANNDGLLTAADDSVEEEDAGHVLVANRADGDGDHIPGYLDGFDWFGGLLGDDDDVDDDGAFSPLELRVGCVEEADAVEILLLYDLSDPAEIELADAPRPLAPGPGGLRLWRRDAGAPRDGARVQEGGDLVAPGVYTLEQLGLSSAGGTVDLWVECIDASVSPGDLEITATLHVQADGTAIVENDRVVATGTRLELRGRSWGAQLEIEHVGILGSTAIDPLRPPAWGVMPGTWTSYRVAIRDPRPGLQHATVGEHTLPLTAEDDWYVTERFVCFSEDEPMPAIQPARVIRHDFAEPIEVGYTLAGGAGPPTLGKKREVTVRPVPRLSGAEEILAVSFVHTIESMVQDGWEPNNPKNPGAFGWEVHSRMTDDFADRKGWVVDVYVDNQTFEIRSIDGESVPGFTTTNTTQIDVAYILAGDPPEIGETWVSDHMQVYELKAGVDLNEARVRQQLNKLDVFSKEPAAVIRSPRSWCTRRFRFVDNPRFKSAVQIGAAVGAVSIVGEIADAAVAVVLIVQSSRDDDELRAIERALRNMRNGGHADCMLASQDVVSLIKQYFAARLPSSIGDVMVVLTYPKVIEAYCGLHGKVDESCNGAAGATEP